MPRVHDLCSMIQNASRARKSLVAVPSSMLNLGICLQLQHHGFISSIQRGDISGPDKIFTPTTPANVARRRIWLGLKYRDNEPVLNKVRAISKPSMKIWVKKSELEDILAGRKTKHVGTAERAEVFILSTDKGITDAVEAVRNNIGGQLLVRANWKNRFSAFEMTCL